MGCVQKNSLAETKRKEKRKKRRSFPKENPSVTQNWTTSIKLRAMTVLTFFGCVLTAFGPPLAMFIFTIAKDPVRILVLILR